MKAPDFIAAARVPLTLHAPQDLGLWTIERVWAMNRRDIKRLGGFAHQTVLRRATMATLHLGGGEIVMEDSRRELSRHLPIWLRARGRVLVTGLGLGCVVRGLLASSLVDHIDVVEIDPRILRAVGPEFEDSRRVSLHLGDALTIEWPAGTGWDFAWHDVWSEERHLDLVHAELIARYVDHCDRQGAWMMTRWVKRRLPPQLALGGARRRCSPCSEQRP